MDSEANAFVDRIRFLIHALMGRIVEVELEDGSRYEGIFAGMKKAALPDTMPDVELCMVRCVLTPDVAKQSYATRTFLDMKKAAAGQGTKQDDEKKRIRAQPVWVVPGGSLRQLIARDVGLRAEDVGDISLADELCTDAALAKASAHRGPRELEAWVPDDEGVEFLTLEESAKAEKGWDQFKANEAAFGVKTSFDEKIYTTSLEKGSCAISEEEAERIAREIEGKATKNPHLMEERGQALDAFGEEVDEEDKYSSVRREIPVTQQTKSEEKLPKKAAWSQPGAGAALLSGKAGNGSVSAPIGIPKDVSVDSAMAKESSEFIKQEHRRLRQHLANPKPPASTVGSPGARHALNSPLVSDPKAVQALNLEPGLPRMEQKTLQEFQKFKEVEEAKKRIEIGSERDQKNKELHEFAAQLRLKDKKTHGNESGPRSNEKKSNDLQKGSDEHKKEKLNPNAKPFSFNPNARAFVLPQKPQKSSTAGSTPFTSATYMPVGVVPGAMYPTGPSMAPPGGMTPRVSPMVGPLGASMMPGGQGHVVQTMATSPPMVYGGSPTGPQGLAPYVPPPAPPKTPYPGSSPTDGT